MRIFQRSLSLLRRTTVLQRGHIASPKWSSQSAESVEALRARLVYQSRKRGTLENDLLLSTFAKQNLDKFSESQLRDYDALINESTTNEWDIYYWCTGKIEVPEEVKRNSIFAMLVEHTKNTKREQRFHMPPL